MGLRKPTGFLYNQVYNEDTTVHDCCLPQTNQHTPLPYRQSVRRVVSHTSPPAPASHPPTHKVHWLRPCSPQAIGRRSAQLPLQSAALKYGGRRGGGKSPALPLAKQSLAEAKQSLAEAKQSLAELSLSTPPPCPNGQTHRHTHMPTATRLFPARACGSGQRLGR